MGKKWGFKKIFIVLMCVLILGWGVYFINWNRSRCGETEILIQKYMNERGFCGEISAHPKIYKTKEEILEVSDVIFIGRIECVEGIEEAAGVETETAKIGYTFLECKIEIEEIVKGDLKEGEEIHCNQYLGVIFNDRTSLDLDEIVLYNEGDRYLFLMANNEDYEDTYSPISAFQGQIPLRGKLEEEMKYLFNSFGDFKRAADLVKCIKKESIIK